MMSIHLPGAVNMDGEEEKQYSLVVSLDQASNDTFVDW